MVKAPLIIEVDDMNWENALKRSNKTKEVWREDNDRRVLINAIQAINHQLPLLERYSKKLFEFKHDSNKESLLNSITDSLEIITTHVVELEKMVKQ
tara:strand:- start:115 stop:402 length:288 start_codon:yes stop_codon:yes gene_type:complete